MKQYNIDYIVYVPNGYAEGRLEVKRNSVAAAWYYFARIVGSEFKVAIMTREGDILPCMVRTGGVNS